MCQKNKDKDGVGLRCTGDPDSASVQRRHLPVQPPGVSAHPSSPVSGAIHPRQPHSGQRTCQCPRGVYAVTGAFFHPLLTQAVLSTGQSTLASPTTGSGPPASALEVCMMCTLCFAECCLSLGRSTPASPTPGDPHPPAPPRNEGGKWCQRLTRHPGRGK